MATRYRRLDGVDEERLDDERILLHPTTANMCVLNETAAILWDAVAEFDTADALAQLIVEGRPEIAETESRAFVDTFVRDLSAAGLLLAVES